MLKIRNMAVSALCFLIYIGIMYTFFLADHPGTVWFFGLFGIENV